MPQTLHMPAVSTADALSLGQPDLTGSGRGAGAEYTGGENAAGLGDSPAVLALHHTLLRQVHAQTQRRRPTLNRLGADALVSSQQRQEAEPFALALLRSLSDANATYLVQREDNAQNRNIPQSDRRPCDSAADHVDTALPGPVQPPSFVAFVAVASSSSAPAPAPAPSLFLSAPLHASLAGLLGRYAFTKLKDTTTATALSVLADIFTALQSCKRHDGTLG